MRPVSAGAAAGDWGRLALVLAEAGIAATKAYSESKDLEAALFEAEKRIADERARAKFPTFRED